MSAELQPQLSVGSMFAGIGGIDLGLERTGGFRTAWFAEISKYASAVLRKHWPDVPNHGDVRNIDEHTERVDVIAAGFPCQPVSLVGKGLAQEDPRWLWPEVARVVGLLRPRYVLLENVPGLTNRGLNLILADLTTLGYDAEWDVVAASSVGAHHSRERIFVVAYAQSIGLEERRLSSVREEGSLSDTSRRSGLCLSASEQGSQGSSRMADSDSEGQPNTSRRERSQTPRRKVFVPGHAGRGPYVWEAEPPVDRVVDGLPGGVDRLTCLGNAVVPQVAEAVGHLILEAEAS